MSTIKFYQQDVYCRELGAKITSVQDTKKGPALTLDQTIFFPTGGGQPCDIGIIRDTNGNEYHVTETLEDKESGEILHYLGTESGKLAFETLHDGDTVTLELDWNNRLSNMQRHSGEHILTGAFIQLFGGANKGFHIGSNYITIDMDYEGTRLTDEQVQQAETYANEVIWNNLPITVSFFPDKYAASTMPTRKPVTQDGEITIVTIGDIEQPHDCVACCGTHFKSTSEVGLIKILKHEPNKGMNRIYFLCGKDALRHIQEEATLLRTVEDRFSTGSEDLLHKMDVQEEKQNEIHQDYIVLLRHVIEQEKESIRKDFAEQGAVPFYSRDFERIPSDELVKLGYAIMEDANAPSMLALVHKPDHTVMLFSDGSEERNCGKLVQSLAKPLGGKGGGRPNQARAILPNAAGESAFIEALKN